MWLLEPLHVGRGAQPTAPEAGALPETGRYRATFQKSKSYRLLVLEVIGGDEHRTSNFEHRTLKWKKMEKPLLI
jgi:hypothetical protein